MKRASWTRVCVLGVAFGLVACSEETASDEGDSGTEAEDAGSSDSGSDEDGAGTDSGSEDDSGDLLSFEAGPCKKHAGDSGEREGGLFPLKAYEGLQCIAWDTTDPAVAKIDLFNFHEGCEIEWVGDASVEPDGTVELRLLNPGCGAAGCGWCIYDWYFSVANVPQKDELSLRVLTDIWVGCEDAGGAPHQTYEALLPQRSDPVGVMCRYANRHAIADQAETLGTCGALFMPCHIAEEDGPGPCMYPEGAPPCREGLVCADGEDDGNRVCHLPCEVDEDCPWGRALACRNGLCRPANPW